MKYLQRPKQSFEDIGIKYAKTLAKKWYFILESNQACRSLPGLLIQTPNLYSSLIFTDQPDNIFKTQI